MKQLSVNISDVDAAYLAGLIDGEGCLNFYRTKNKSCTVGYTYVARMSITNCDLTVLLEIRDLLGIGSVTKKCGMRPRCKPAYQITFYAREVRHLLPWVMPYMRIKKRQAELVYNFVSRQRWGGCKGGLSQKEHEQRNREKAELAVLNQRGVLN